MSDYYIDIYLSGDDRPIRCKVIDVQPVGYTANDPNAKTEIKIDLTDKKL